MSGYPQYQYAQGQPQPFGGPQQGAPPVQGPPPPPGSCPRPVRPPNPCVDAPCGVSSTLRCDAPKYYTNLDGVMCPPKIRCFTPAPTACPTNGGPPGRPVSAPIGTDLGAAAQQAPSTPQSQPVGDSYDGYGDDDGHKAHKHRNRRDEVAARMQEPDVISSISNNIDPTHPNATVSRRFFVSRTFSLKEAHQNNKVCAWRAHPWSIMRRFLHDKANPFSRTGDLSTCLLAHAAVVQASNDHVVPFGVSITGINGNTYTEFGPENRFAFVLMPTNGTPVNWGKRGIRIYRPRSILGSNTVRNWGGLKAEYLNHGIRWDKDWCYVDHRHPLIKVLRDNEGPMRYSLDDCRTIRNGTVYEITRQMAEPILQRIKTEIIERIPYVHMGEMTVAFRRADVVHSTTDHYISPEGNMRAYDGTDLYNFHIDQAKTVALTLDLDYIITSPQSGRSGCN